MHCKSLRCLSVVILAIVLSHRANECQGTDPTWEDREPTAATSARLFDHHVHLLSPTLLAHWKSAGMHFSREDSAYTDPVRLLETEPIQGAFLVSMAHLYATDRLWEIKEVGDSEQQLVAEENNFIAACVATDPQNLIGFFSVHPLRPYAMAELERCRRRVGLTGLKLHLPACGIDLNDDTHLNRLRTIFAWAERHRVPILLHLFSEERVAKALAHRFWWDVVKPHPGIELYLAHLGGAGGYHEGSQAVLEGFEALCRDEATFSDAKIFFDLSGAILVEETDGFKATSPDLCRAAGEHMRRIGWHRFLFASDYPVFSAQSTVDALRQKLSLADDDLARLLSNRSPRFGGKRGRDIGVPFEGTPGELNAITDVDGVLVGHATIIHDGERGSARTGVTAILPSRSLDRMFAGTFVLNGNGELTGKAFVDEWGFLISPVMLTNTLSVGTVRDGVVKWADSRPHIQREVNLPVVGETWDGFLNDIRGFHVREEHVFSALDSAGAGPVAEGNVGGGTGMVCHVFKGGIGTASRKLPEALGAYTVGVLVQANYGTRETLTVAARRRGEGTDE